MAVSAAVIAAPIASGLIFLSILTCVFFVCYSNRRADRKDKDDEAFYKEYQQKIMEAGIPFSPPSEGIPYPPSVAVPYPFPEGIRYPPSPEIPYPPPGDVPYPAPKADIYPPPTEPPAALQTIYVQETHVPPLGLSPSYAAPTGNTGAVYIIRGLSGTGGSVMSVFSGVTPFDFNRANRINRSRHKRRGSGRGDGGGGGSGSGDGGGGGGDGGGGGGGDGGC